MIEAGKRGELGGIWTVNSNYSFISITNNNTDITLIKKFGNWSYSDRGIEQRMPWITNQSVNAILTTSSDANSEWWGTIISSQTTDNWEPAPWMRDAIDYGTIFSCQNPQRPKILWYWVR